MYGAERACAEGMTRLTIAGLVIIGLCIGLAVGGVVGGLAGAALERYAAPVRHEMAQSAALMVAEAQAERCRISLVECVGRLEE